MKIGRFFPSSKFCSACGALAEQMPLAVREWTCPCGVTHDRDVNAEINIRAEGRRIVAAGRKPVPEMGGKRRRKTPAETGKTPPPAPRGERGARSMKQEATEVPRDTTRHRLNPRRSHRGARQKQNTRPGPAHRLLAGAGPRGRCADAVPPRHRRDPERSWTTLLRVPRPGGRAPRRAP
ncbi:zinc ribbon domain-containing protein [Nonomuraea sp. NPDC051941]|uniref:zinc ribbon domain-containing protein n=1 Tax=Nonomuraea sp. NPDC051941 TaxID=3364373 RepID=UPI0037CC1257